MNKRQQAYVEVYVSAARVRRRADAAEAEWDRWIERAQLAERLGETELARLARQRAIQAAEREVALRVHLDRQTHHLAVLRDRVG